MENTDKKIAKVPTNDESCVTYVLNGESHTIGNPLHRLISNQQEVKFCGYSTPHILEKKINFRIETKSPDGLAIDSLHEGLKNFGEMMKHVGATFDTAVKEYKRSSVKTN